jgi:hypothetical protein
MRWRVTPLTAFTLLAVGCLNLLLMAAVARQIRAYDTTGSDGAAWDARLAGSIEGVTGRKPAEAYGQIIAHPVFFKSREPFVPPPPVPVPAAIAQPPAIVVDPGLVVGGVMVKRGLSKAYLFSRAGPGGMWASEGETFQGWRVKSIDQSGVRLEQGGRSIELLLYPPL